MREIRTSGSMRGAASPPLLYPASRPRAVGVLRANEAMVAAGSSPRSESPDLPRTGMRRMGRAGRPKRG